MTEADPQTLRDAAHFFFEVAGWLAAILAAATAISVALGLIRSGGIAQQMQDDGE